MAKLPVQSATNIDWSAIPSPVILYLLRLRSLNIFPSMPNIETDPSKKPIPIVYGSKISTDDTLAMWDCPISLVNCFSTSNCTSAPFSVIPISKLGYGSRIATI